MEATTTNYDSGDDFVLECGNLRFTFNEEDFVQRCEHAALLLDFIERPLESGEQQDLLSLTVNGEIVEPVSDLGSHIKNHSSLLLSTEQGSNLVHSLRKVILQGAWFDQMLLTNQLEVRFCEQKYSFNYVRCDDSPISLEIPEKRAWSQCSYPQTD